MGEPISYAKALEILERELRIDKIQIDRHSVEHIMLMVPVVMLSEIYGISLINVASDLKRKFLKGEVYASIS